jgi:hypothetical protein
MLDENGHIAAADPHCRSLSHLNVFVANDVCNLAMARSDVDAGPHLSPAIMVSPATELSGAVLGRQL